jgi:hypothetical protein
MKVRATTAAALLAGGLALLPLAARAQQSPAQLLAVDTRLNRVVTLNAHDGSVINGSFITDANDPTRYDFQTPRAAIQVGNQVWVSDQSPSINAIYRFDLSGTYLGTIGGTAGGLSNVRGMRYINGTVYAVNAGTANNAPGPALVRIATDGTILGSFSTVVGQSIGAQPWDVVHYGDRLLVSDGTSRALQFYGFDGSWLGAFTGELNNIPQQMFVRANGNVLLAANGSQPTASFGTYEIGTDGSVVRQWTGTPALGSRGVYELGNGRYLISEAGGTSTTRGLGTIDPNGPNGPGNFTLLQGQWNGGWISGFTGPTQVVPEPGTVGLVLTGLAGLVVVRRRRAR